MKIIEEIEETEEEIIRRFAGKWSNIKAEGLKAVKGTTILAVKYDKGTIIASDKRATAQGAIISETMSKVFPIGKRAAIAVSGSVAPALDAIKAMSLAVNAYERRYGPITIEGMESTLSRIIKRFFPVLSQGLVVVPILASKEKIYAFDTLGASFEKEFWATGSGGPAARPVLSLGFRKNLSRSAAIKLIVRALNEASKADSATGGKHLVIADISEKGVRILSEEEIKAFLTVSKKEVKND